MSIERKHGLPKDQRLLVIACGMIAREILAVKQQLALDHVELTCLPAEFHFYPDRIAPAMDKAIEEAKAEGRLRAASKEYQAKLLEAKMIADSNRIIGESLTANPLFLYWHQIKVYGEAAAGPNNVLNVPYEALGGGEHGFLNSPLVRASLERVQANAGSSPIISPTNVEELLKSAEEGKPSSEKSIKE